MNRQNTLATASSRLRRATGRKGAPVHSEQLAAHLRVARYGDFNLTDAVRPGLNLKIIPREGYRIDSYRDESGDLEVPLLAASVSRERLFDTFLELLGGLGPIVDVVLETSHHNKDGTHRDLLREQIDLPVLCSHLVDFEDLLLNDGCTGIAVISAGEAREVQFDEHKLLVVYAHELEEFEGILNGQGIERDNQMKLITENEHYHASDDRHHAAFEELCQRLGIGETAESLLNDDY